MTTKSTALAFLLLVSGGLFGHCSPLLEDEDLCKVYGDDWECEENFERVSQNQLLEEATYNCSSNLVETTIKLMEEGDAKIKLTENGEAVLMIGLTGTGKTTLVYFVAGNESSMISYKSGPGEFLIKDCNGKIGDSTTISATIFPDLVIEDSTNTAFYDNPGFQDTRTHCIEIANAYFMRKVAENITRVKFVAVADYNSVKNGGSRDTFVKLLKSLMNFIPNIQKFEDGLATIITKLPNPLVSNEEYLCYIAKFMKDDVLPGLPESFEGFPNDLEKATFMVNTFLKQTQTANPDEYPRIGLFRMPDSCGPLDTIPIMIQNKIDLLALIEKLNYVESTPTDFGVTISADAINSILIIGKQLSDETIDLITQFKDQLLSYQDHQQTECLDNLDCDPFLSSIQLLFENPDFVAGYPIDDSWTDLTFTEIIDRITISTILPPGLEIPEQIQLNLAKNGKYLDFLQGLTNLDVSISYWLLPMITMQTTIFNNLQKFSDILNPLIESEIRDYSAELSSFMTDQTECDISDCDGVVTSLNTLIGNQHFMNNFEDFDPSLNAATLISQIIDPQHLPLEPSEETLNTLHEHSHYLDTLIGFLPQLKPDLSSWVVPLKSFKTDLISKVKTLGTLVHDDSQEVLERLSSQLDNFLAGQFECVEANSCEDIVGSLKTMFFNPAFVQGYTNLSEWNSLTYTQISSKLAAEKFIPSGLEIPTQVFTQLNANGEKLDLFIEIITKLDSNLNQWLKPFHQLKLNVNEKVQTLFSKLDTNLVDIIKNLSTILITKFKRELNNLSGNDQTGLTNLQNEMQNLFNSSYVCTNDPNPLLPSECMNGIVVNIETFNFDLGQDELSILEKQSEELDYFESIKDNNSLVIDFDRWIKHLLTLNSTVQDYFQTNFSNTIKDNFDSALNSVNSEMLRIKMDEFNGILDVNERQKEMEEFMANVDVQTDLINSTLSSSEIKLENLISLLIGGFTSLGMPASSQVIESLSSQFELLGFIDDLQGSTLIPKDDYEIWIRKLGSLNLKIENEITWTTFTLELMSDLTHIRFHADNEGGLKEWWKEMVEVTVPIFDRFWTKFKVTSAVEYNDQSEILKIIQSDEVNKLKSLNLLLSTLLDPTTCKDEGSGNSSFEGNFLILSQILGSECIKTGQTKSLVIRAYHTFFIDQDLKGDEFGPQLILFVMAPIWWIRSDKSFNVNGLSGSPPQPLAVDGQGTTMGKVGTLGGNSGNIFGIAESITQGSLTVILNGGNGGQGQGGQRGVDGEKGAFQDVQQHHDPDCAAWSGGDIQVKKYPNTCNSNGGTCHAGDDGVVVRVDGLSGTSGKNGAHGGKGGSGGLAGINEIIQVGDNTASITKKASNGVQGADGAGGAGGQGGAKGDTHSMTIDDHSGAGGKWCEIWNKHLDASGVWASNGQKGDTGGNSNGLEKPNPQTAKMGDFLGDISTFKVQAARLIKNEFLSQFMTNFITRVNANPSIPK